MTTRTSSPTLIDLCFKPCFLKPSTPYFRHRDLHAFVAAGETLTHQSRNHRPLPQQLKTLAPTAAAAPSENTFSYCYFEMTIVVFISQYHITGVYSLFTDGSTWLLNRCVVLAFTRVRSLYLDTKVPY